VRSDLDRLLQPAIRIRTQPADEATIPSGASKLGGLPDLPQGSAWPAGKGKPLAFIGQIRLEDARGCAAALALPPSGTLSFFYDAAQETYGADPADRGGWQVLYFAADASLIRTPAPTELPQEARYHACAVTLTDELTLPVQPELEIPSLDWTDDELANYEQAWATFPAPEEHGTIHNRLLGHPDTLQDDMRLECQLASNGVNAMDDPRVTRLSAGAMDWRLLLQVDSDPNAGMRWASAGMLYFWIQEQALRARQFDNVWVVLQSD
jgi:uncharacterized protein YwqG